jgi:uncharacterized protein (TIGR02996 family)
VIRNEAILSAILEAPDDDAPRLVYADWLEEHGDEARADFIRVQLELARVPDYEPGWIELRRREQALLAEHGQGWRQEVAGWARPGAVFRRGFVGEVWCTASELLKGGSGLFRRAPVRGITLRKASHEQVEDLARSPLLGRLRRLHLTSGCERDLTALRGLLSSPHVGNLRGLRLYLRAYGGPAVEHGQLETAQALAWSARLGGLASLELDGFGPFGEAGAEALAKSPHLTGLTTLRANNNSIGAGGARALASSPFLPQLTTLGLTVQSLGAPGAVALAEGLVRGRLRHLDLSRNRRFGDAGAAALAASPGLAHLAVLHLVECGVGPAGARALAQSPYLGELRHLVLAQCPVGEEGALALASSQSLKNLTLLNLRGSALGVGTVEALASSPSLPRLAFLLVENTTVAPGDWARLKQRFGAKVLSISEAWSFAGALGRPMTSVTRLDDFPNCARD